MKGLLDYQKKLKLLQLAKKYHNVSKACKEMNVSRQHYYDVEKLYKKGGVKALKESGRHKPHLKKRFSKEVENMVTKIAKEHPEFGQIRVSKILQDKGVKISSGGVRCIWKRILLDSPQKRIKYAIKKR
jgi:transposase